VGPDGIPLMVGQLGCDDGGDCPATVAFSGTLYFVGDAEVQPGLVGELLAKRDESVPLEILARFGQARAVRGVAPDVLIALGPYRLGGETTEGEERWVWASPIFGDGDSRLTVALCAVVVDANLDC
jgi:hypothetical protein